MHNPHNQEIQNAFAALLSSKTVKNQAQVAKALGVSSPLLSRILSGKEKASPEFCKKFEEKYLKPLNQILKDWKEPQVINPGAKIHATHEEYTSAKVLRLEIMMEELMSLCASIRAHQEGLVDNKGKVDATPIRERLTRSVDAKVAKAQVLLSGK